MIKYPLITISIPLRKQTTYMRKDVQNTKKIYTKYQITHSLPFFICSGIKNIKLEISTAKVSKVQNFSGILKNF